VGDLGSVRQHNATRSITDLYVNVKLMKSQLCVISYSQNFALDWSGISIVLDWSGISIVLDCLFVKEMHYSELDTPVPAYSLLNDRIT